MEWERRNGKKVTGKLVGEMDHNIAERKSVYDDKREYV